MNAIKGYLRGITVDAVACGWVVDRKQGIMAYAHWHKDCADTTGTHLEIYDIYAVFCNGINTVLDHHRYFTSSTLAILL
jgi:hypothetical protein